MSEAKFTKGPWLVSGTATINQKPKGWIASVSTVDRTANAHLIAAAPELYEALYRLVRDCEIAGLQEQAGFDCWISMANAALAKARGEAE